MTLEERQSQMRDRIAARLKAAKTAKVRRANAADALTARLRSRDAKTRASQCYGSQNTGEGKGSHSTARPSPLRSFGSMPFPSSRTPQPKALFAI